MKKETKKFTLYGKITEGAKETRVHYFTNKSEAEAYSKKFKAWPRTYIVKARNEKGQYTQGWALVCCK